MNAEQLRRSQAALDRLTRRAQGPKSARLYQYDVDAAEAVDETEQTFRGGNR